MGFLKGYKLFQLVRTCHSAGNSKVWENNKYINMNEIHTNFYLLTEGEWLTNPDSQLWVQQWGGAGVGGVSYVE